MHIAVCIKQVPEKAEVMMIEGRFTLAREGVPSQINAYDLAALEIALQLKRKFRGQITVLTMGPPSAEEALREALAMGAEKGILITDPALAGSDTLATSRVLGAALRKLDPSPSLILCGARSSDSDTGHVPPQVAEELNLNHISCASRVELVGSEILLKRKMGKWNQTVKVKLPALVSVLDTEWQLGHLNLRDIPLAFEEKELSVWSLKDLQLREEEVGLKGSATRVRRIKASEEKRKGEVFQGPPQEAVQVILRALRNRGVI